MAKNPRTKEPSPLRKTGYTQTPAAVELTRSLADILKTEEGIIHEVGVRMVFDALLSSGQKDAISTILRAKGESIRNLRKLNNATTGDGAGETPEPETPGLDRLKTISVIHRNSTIPLDQALEEMSSN